MKKGFVFIETIVVLVVAMVAMLSIYTTYSVTTKNVEKKEKYDNINDIYKLNAVATLFDSLDIEDSYIIVNSDNCSTYMNSDCSDIFDNLNIEQIILTSDDVNNILESNPTNISNEIKSYMGTLDKTKPLLIINIENEKEKRFASLKKEEIIVDSSGEGVYVYPYKTTSYTLNITQTGTYLLEAWGAQGGNAGGSGGYIRAQVSLTAGNTLTIYTGGIDGTNGGGASAGTGSYTGGGSTIIKLGSTNLIIAAGGGAKGTDGTAGGVGGSGNSAGGVTVGAGTGTAGTNGGGGSSSPNYITQYCSYCNVSELDCDEIFQSESSVCSATCSATVLHTPCSYNNQTISWVSACDTTGCSGSTPKRKTTTTIKCSCSTSSYNTSSCSGSYNYCITWSDATTYGKPGNGGTSSAGTGATLDIKIDGLNSSNGRARISLVE